MTEGNGEGFLRFRDLREAGFQFRFPVGTVGSQGEMHGNVLCLDTGETHSIEFFLHSGQVLPAFQDDAVAG